MTTKFLVLLGNGGHASVVSDAATCSGLFRILGRVDLEGFHGDSSPYEIGSSSTIDTILRGNSSPLPLLHCAIGSSSERSRLVSKYCMRYPYISWAIVQHPDTTIAQSASLGHGCFVGAGARIGANARCGSHVLINTNASIDHDCFLGDYVNVGPGASIAGSVSIGANTIIGIGAIVIQGIKIGSSVTVAAGAVVVNDIPSGSLVKGIPAR